MRPFANISKFLAAFAGAAMLLSSRDAGACVTDYDCDVDYYCCADSSCYYLSCPSSSGCSSDADCSVGEGCCSDGTCDSACAPTSSCTSSETDCGDYCCDSSFPVCCGGGTCGEDSSCSACPSSAPNDCNDGFCCDDAHPFCCGGGTCSSSSSCTVTVGGSGSGTKSVGISGGPAPKQWGCSLGPEHGETPWGTMAAAALGLVVVARRKRGRK